MRRRTILMVYSLLLLSAGSRADRGEFHDYARVVDVEPIIEDVGHGPEGSDCGGGSTALDAADPPEVFAASIGADVRRQNRPDAAPGPAECSPTREAGRISGYRVTYRYRGKTLVRRLQQPPEGDLPVRVRIRALP
jgi:hypothetical protein